jgi:predicted naringenin-chalcone synthase
MAYVSAIGVANPPHKVPQMQIADFMIRAMQLEGARERKLRAVFRSSGIDYRYSVLADYASRNGMVFFPNTRDLEPFPTTSRRMEQFRCHAVTLSMQAVDNAMSDRYQGHDFSHLITVCCTGMYAPGLDLEIMRRCGLSSSVHRLSLNFMGCYAAINALRTANALCDATPGSRVLVVCVELCSLHFQKEYSEDNLLANALFSDGAAAVVIESQPSERGLRLAQFHSIVVEEGHSDMAWNVGDYGFEMRLSSYIPDLVRDGVRDLGQHCLEQAGLQLGEIDYFAIHPGGKRILDAVEQQLHLPPDRNRFARDVLRECGNMSSPSVLFVLKRIWDSLVRADNGKTILALAFGPGLTLESMVLRVESRS